MGEGAAPLALGVGKSAATEGFVWCTWVFLSGFFILSGECDHTKEQGLLLENTMFCFQPIKRLKTHKFKWA